MKLTEQSINVLTYMEQVYYETGEFPTDERLSEVTGVRLETIRNYWKDADFRAAVASRGMVVDAVDDSKALTMPQLMLANMLMNPYDRRSMREKLKDPSIEAFGITVAQANAWMRSTRFQDHLRKRAKALFGQAEPAAYMNFVKAIESGDQKAIAMYFEMTGVYNPKVQVDVNISVVLSRVVEIISKHVKDPDTLQLIANDLDGLELGGASPAALPLGGLPDAIDVPVRESAIPNI